MIRRSFAQNIVLLSYYLERDSSSIKARLQESSETELLDDVNFRLQMPPEPRRPKHEEAQITSLVRTLFEASGGHVKDQQHGFGEEFTVEDNARLFALSIIETEEWQLFGTSSAEQVYQMLTGSAMYKGVAFDVEQVQLWADKLCSRLPIFFRPQHLVILPSSIGSSVG